LEGLEQLFGLWWSGDFLLGFGGVLGFLGYFCQPVYLLLISYADISDNIHNFLKHSREFLFPIFRNPIPSQFKFPKAMIELLIKFSINSILFFLN
jgi:hypothetical protein